MNAKAVHCAIVFVACAVIVAIGLATNAPKPAEPAAPPHKWAFPRGAFVVRTVHFRSGAGEVESIERTDVVARDERSVTLRHHETINGKAHEPELETVGTSEEPADPAGAERLGRERIEAAGRAFDCVAFRKVVGDSTYRFWLAAGVPWPVRFLEERRAGDRVIDDTEIRLVKLDEPIALGPGALPCAVFEEVHRAEGREVDRAKSWRSAEVPGHEVRREATLDNATTITIRVVAYGSESKK